MRTIRPYGARVEGLRAAKSQSPLPARHCLGSDGSPAAVAEPRSSSAGGGTGRKAPVMCAPAVPETKDADPAERLRAGQDEAPKEPVVRGADFVEEEDARDDRQNVGAGPVPRNEPMPPAKLAPPRTIAAVELNG